MEKVFILESTDISNKLIQEWELNINETYLIGRNMDKSRIIINDSTISRVHAEISFQKPFKIFLKDLGSANGTFLNGKQIEKNTSVEIIVGSMFILGDSKTILKIKEKLPIKKQIEFETKAETQEFVKEEKKLLKVKRQKSEKEKKKSKKKSEIKKKEKNTDNNIKEKLREYLSLREKIKKNDFNLDDILQNENPNLQQIKIDQKVSIIYKKNPESNTKLNFKQWIRSKDHVYH